MNCRLRVLTSKCLLFWAIEGFITCRRQLINLNEKGEGTNVCTYIPLPSTVFVYVCTIIGGVSLS